MPERRLMAVMFTDIKGFSTLMGEDEAGTYQMLNRHNAVMDPCVHAHNGELVKRIGDSYMVRFPSALDALQCAVAMQKALTKLNRGRKQKIQVRIGIDSGDVIIGKDKDLHGHIVNMAKRRESEAWPGGICVSESVRQNISVSERNAFTFEDAGLLSLKGSSEPVQAWHIRPRRQGGMSPEERKMLRKYCQRLIANNELLDFKGILQVREVLRLRLEDLYVPLWATTEAMRRLLSRELAEAQQMSSAQIILSHSRARGIEGQDIESDEALLHELTQAERLPERRVEIAQALRENHRLVVLGDPGTGKSTLLKLLALTFARGTEFVREKFQLDEDRLPLLIPIAAYGEAVTKDRDLTFDDFLSKRLAADGLEDSGVVQRALERGECILLLDGLDEVLDLNTRIQVSRQLDRFIRDCDPRNRVVVTSRIAGYQRVGFTGDFAHLTLLSFDDEEIKAFARNWSRAYESSPKPTTGWERRAEQRAEQLTEAILSTPAVRRLAANPLLVTILALIQQQGTRLPHQRVELYRLCVEALAEHWQRARSLYRPIDLYLGARHFNERYIVGVLAPIAFWLFENRPTGLLHRTELEQRIAERLVSQEGVKEIDAPSLAHEFVELIREQSGLLIERGADLFDFLHPTFKEYLAARHLAERRDPLKLLGRHLFAPRWREVILLTAGILKGDYLDDFLNSILKSGMEYDDILRRPLFLAARCLADDVVVSAPLRRQILDELLKLWKETPFSSLRRAIGDLFAEAKGSRIAEEIATRILSLAEDKAEGAWVRSYAAQALGQLGEQEKAAQILLSLAQDKAVDELVRRDAALALGQLGEREKAAQILLSLAQDKAVDELVRRDAAEALGLLGERSERVINGLLSLAQDKAVDELVRINAALALGQLGERSKRVINILLSLVQEREENVFIRGNAAWALGQLGKRSERVTNVLLSLVQEKEVDKWIQLGAACALVELKEKNERVINSLLTLTQEKEVNVLVRSIAALTLGLLEERSERVINGLLSLAQDEEVDALIRVRAAQALSQWIERRKTAQILLSLSQDKKVNIVIRSYAAQTLGQLGWSDKKVLDTLAQIVRTEDKTSELCDKAWAALLKLANIAADEPT